MPLSPLRCVKVIGPENYVVACEEVNVGTYEIAVNYFNGNSPETATVALFLGDGRSITPKKISLTSSKGTEGDSKPTTVFKVEVTEDDEGAVIYSVN